MTRHNRVLPIGEFADILLRGLLMGNRGILHDAERHLGPARWRHKAWIACALAFKDRRRAIMAPGRYTELFFHDEAVAFAAGHRPCAECRRSDHVRFLDAWERAHGERPRTADLDRMLHAARLDGRAQWRHHAAMAGLPDGTFVLRVVPCLVLGAGLHPFGAEGYGPALPRPADEEAEVLTPAPLVTVLHAGSRLCSPLRWRVALKRARRAHT